MPSSDHQQGNLRHLAISSPPASSALDSQPHQQHTYNMEANYWAFFGLNPTGNDTADTTIMDPSALSDSPWIHDITPRDGAEGSRYDPTAMPRLQQQQPVGEDINSQTENNRGARISSTTSAGRLGEAEVKRQESQGRERNRVAAIKCRAKMKRETEHKQSHLKGLQTKNDCLKADLTSLEKERHRLRETLTEHGHCGHSDIDAWIRSEATELVYQGGFDRQPG